MGAPMVDGVLAYFARSGRCRIAVVSRRQESDHGALRPLRADHAGRLATRQANGKAERFIGTIQREWAGNDT